jgi:hypothetical protein
MKETLKRTPVEGHLRAMTTAMRLGPPICPIGERLTVRRSDAFSGLISIARRSAATSFSIGRLLGRQTIIDMVI